MKKILMLLCLSQFTTCDPVFAQVDPLEYAPGHPNVAAMPTFIDQVNTSPFPRFKAGHTLMPLYNVVDQIYSGDYKQPGVTDQVAVDRSVAIQLALAKRGYMINLGWFSGYYNDQTIQLANTYPQYKRAIMTLRAQTNTLMFSQGFPNMNYLQNSQGQFLDWSGGVTTSNNKTWSPRSNPQDYAADGDVVRSAYQTSLQNLNGLVDFVNEDGEVTPIIEQGGIFGDPNVVNDMNASGKFMQQFPFIKWFPYLGWRVAQNDLAYSSRFMSLPKLQGAKYTEYRLCGQVSYEVGAWEETRKINTKINNQYYSTPDLYVRWPNNWKDWVSAWHGLKWVSQARYCEIFLGDKLFSPFVAAGWDCNEENNVRPGQWLGLLKVMGIFGAEFYYVCFFNEYTTVPCNPKGYAWQNITATYAQEVTSKYEDILRKGDLMNGDIMDNTYPLGAIPKYQFSTGAENKLVFGRKYGNEYVILGIIENYSNVINSTPINSTATFNLEGETITLPIARHGKTFRYNKVNKTLRLLDGHHEYVHPVRWSKDWNEEFENADTTNGTLKTYFNAGSTNWTNFKSTILLTVNQFANFHITPTVAETKYLFVKSDGSGTCELTFDGNKQTANISGGWNRLGIGAISADNHNFILKALSALELDSICITGNINKYPVSVCVPPSAVISASNPDPCIGDTVLLSASTGVSYLWSDSRTTQTISVFNNLTYTVTVSNSNCSSVSAPYTVTFKTCSSCRPPTDIQILNVNIRNFIVSWSRIAEADSGYTVFVDDVTPGFNLHYTFKRIQSKPGNLRPQLKATGLKARHNYLVTVASRCKGMDSEKSTPPVPVTTKAPTTSAKLSTR